MKYFCIISDYRRNFPYCNESNLPVTPLAFIGSLAALELIAGNDPIYQVLSGGLLLGAFFMATDYVTTPITSKGKLIFGLVSVSLHL